MNRLTCVARIVACLAACMCVAASQGRVRVPAINTPPAAAVGERHYSFADRKPTRACTFNFDDLSGWTVAVSGSAEGRMVRTREAQIWSRYVAKVSFKQGGPRDRVECRPAKPIPLPDGFDCVNVWVRADKWYIRRKPTVSPHLSLRVRDASGETHTIDLGHHPCKDWFLAHRRVTRPGGTTAQGGDANGRIDHPAVFEALIVDGLTGGKTAALYLDHVCFYKEQLGPLDVKPAPASKLFPTTPDTILPTCHARHEVTASGDATGARFTYRGDDGALTYEIDPKVPGLSGVRARWRDGQAFQPMAGGGPEFVGEEAGRTKPVDDPSVKWTTLAARMADDAYRVDWRMEAGKLSTTGSTTYRLKGKSLIVDVTAPGGHVAGVRIGRWTGKAKPKLVRVPFLTMRPIDPHIVCGHGVFTSALVDWYVTDASKLYGADRVVSATSAEYGGGVKYLPKTDGRRNDVRDRIFLTVSPRFDEVLPNIPNPDNPYAKMMVDRAWWDVGGANMSLIERMYRWGLRKCMMQYNGVIWERGTDFTRRSFYSDGGINVGAQKMRDFGKAVQDMGYLFGLHTNYCIVPPGTHRCWHEDLPVFDSRGEWRTGWGRCYMVKPSLVAQLQDRFTTLKEREFGVSCEYSDQTTAFELGRCTDFDARAPMAGKLRGQFEAHGRFLWRECEMIGGPVISEGPMHWVYAGLAAGNYGQLYGREKPKRPMLLDFDLLKMHTKQCDAGIGITHMFYGRDLNRAIHDAGVHSDWCDRWLAWTLAAGHIAQLTTHWRDPGLIKSFYMVQPAQRHYALVPVAHIRYFDGETLLSTSDAIRSGAVERSQIRVEYENGLTVWVNGSWAEDWLVEAADRNWLLPPAGFLLHRLGKLIEYSGFVSSWRTDHVLTSDACYLDARGRWTDNEVLATDAAMACFRDDKENGVAWVVPSMQPKLVALLPKQLGVKGERFRITAYDAKQALRDVPCYSLGDKIAIKPERGVLAYRVAPGHEQPKPLPGPEPSMPALDFVVSPRRWLSLPEGVAAHARIHIVRRHDPKAPVQVKVATDGAPPHPLTITGQDSGEFRLDSRAAQVRIEANCGEHKVAHAFRLKRSPAESRVADLTKQSAASAWGYCRRGQTEVTAREPQGPGYVRFTRGYGTAGAKRRLAFAAPPVFDRPPHGYVFGEFAVALPQEPCDVTFGIGINDSSPNNDGVTFSVYLTDEQGQRHKLFEAHHTNGPWRDERLSLAAFAGQLIRLRFQTDCGPKDDASNDSARWAEPRIVAAQKRFDVTLVPSRPE